MSLHFVAFLRRYKRALNISRRSVFLGLVFFVILSRRERMTENCSSLRSDVYLVMEQLDYNILLRNISILGEWAKNIRQVLSAKIVRKNAVIITCLITPTSPLAGMIVISFQCNIHLTIMWMDIISSIQSTKASSIDISYMLIIYILHSPIQRVVEG